MKFLIGLSLIILSALTIWAEGPKENPTSAEPVTESKTTEIAEGKCTYMCAFKTLMFAEDGFGRDFLKLAIVYDDESDVDSAFEACNQSSTENDESCEKYFDCVEVEFNKKNITFVVDVLNSALSSTETN